MALDDGRLADDRNRFDDVRIECSLREEIDRSELRRLALEDLDERRADDLSLQLRIGDARQTIHEEARRVHEHERQLQPLESFSHLRRFVQPQHAVVDENAGELLADRAVKDQRGDG